MPKISAFGALAGATLAPGDLVTVVDGSDPTYSAVTGTNKRMTASEFAIGITGINPNWTITNAGVATFASITADATLTVNGGLAVGGTSNLYGNITTAGSVTAASITTSGSSTLNSLVVNNNLVAGGTSNLYGTVTTSGLLNVAGTGSFLGGQSYIGPGVVAEGGYQGITFAGSESGGAGANLASCLDLRGGRGAANAPERNQLGDVVGRVMFAGSSGNVAAPKRGVASINAVATQNWTQDGALNLTGTGTKIEFWTTPNGTVPPDHGQLAMTLGHDAQLTVNGALSVGGTSNLFGDVTTSGSITAAGTIAATGQLTASGNFVVGGTSNLFGNVTTSGAITTSGTLGFAAGAGGTVTQATSKATAITLNKSTGRITLNGAALAANTNVAFTFTNSTIATTDIIDFQHISGGTLGAYWVGANPAAGSATVTVRNTTAGSLSEAPVFAFKVIKSVTT